MHTPIGQRKKSQQYWAFEICKFCFNSYRELFSRIKELHEPDNIPGNIIYNTLPLNEWNIWHFIKLIGTVSELKAITNPQGQE